jgi:hypothetical protein
VFKVNLLTLLKFTTVSPQNRGFGFLNLLEEKKFLTFSSHLQDSKPRISLSWGDCG